MKGKNEEQQGEKFGQSRFGLQFFSDIPLLSFVLFVILIIVAVQEREREVKLI